MSELLTTPELKRAPLKEPAKQWRNKWIGLSGNTCEGCNRVRQTGEVYWDCCDAPFPSLDVAETAAQVQVGYQIENEGWPLEEWLGAFPVEGDA